MQFVTGISRESKPGPASSEEDRSLRKKILPSRDRGSKHPIRQVFFKRDVFPNMLDTKASKNVRYLATLKSEFEMTVINHVTSERKGHVA